MLDQLRTIFSSFGNNRSFHCPVCRKDYGRFRPYGLHPRPNAQCPGCGSLERHRLLWIVLDRMGALSDKTGKRLLHIAPETCLSPKLRQLYEYVSVDLDGSRAMIAMDITKLDFPDDHFDAIVCNHVLEHIPDDSAALSELYRVLKPGGWASIQVPLEGEQTEEDSSVSDPLERERLYGQHDHVRSYGRDFLHRLELVGFAVTVFSKDTLVDKEMLRKISVECETEVWISTKAM